MADRTTPIHSGYSIINASFSGTATAKLGCWMEYKVVSQSVENNTSTIRFYIFIANVAAQGGCHIYCNNYDQTNRGSMTVKANGSTVYTRQKRGFATDLIPTASDYTTQYETPYGSAEDTKFLTVMTDNADTEAAGYGTCVIQHNTDGTGSVTLSWNADCSFANSLKLITGSATVTLPTIPRATTPSVGTLTMGSQGTITLSPASSSFTHTSLSGGYGERQHRHKDLEHHSQLDVPEKPRQSGAQFHHCGGNAVLRYLFRQYAHRNEIRIHYAQRAGEHSAVGNDRLAGFQPVDRRAVPCIHTE